MVAGLAFGWAEPAPPPDACFYGPGFWKHEYAVLAGEKPGCQHLDPELLAAMLPVVASATALDWSGGDGWLEPSDVVAVLAGRSHTHCDCAERHYLVAALNWVFNDAHPGIPVDSTGDGETDATFGEVMARLEELFAGGSEADCREAKGIATAVNETPSEGCEP